MANGTFYRPDIDGLRAVAVLSVIIYHINPNLLQGGFLGVDMFFVISGYLITSLLINDIKQTGKLNLTNFYVRRIKRIIPALLTVLIFTLIIGYILMTPHDYTQLMMSASAAFISFANVFFYFFIDTGYFATDSYEIPLLHLWSLGVEEQYYILWPFIVFTLIRISPRATFPLIAILLVSSFILAQTMIISNPSFSYYMLPTRAWELMAGGIVSFALYNQIKISEVISKSLSITGLLLLIFSFFFITKNSYVPGVGAIPAVMGTVFLIISGYSGCYFFNKVLEHKWIVSIGLISYSAYLWHWPILAFIRYSLLEMDLGIGLAVLVSTLILASLSYHLVEKPLRHLKPTTTKVFINYFSIPLVVLSSLTILFVYGEKNQWQVLYPKKEYLSAINSQPAYKFKYNCQFEQVTAEAFKDDRCISNKKVLPTVLLIGDSNAAHFVGLMRVFSQKYNFSFRNITQSSCPTVFTKKIIHHVDPKYKDGCNTYLSLLPDKIKKYNTIVLGGDWRHYDTINGFRAMLKDTILELSNSNKKIIILSKVPTFKNYNINCEKRKLRIKHLQCDPNRFNIEEQKIEINTYIEDISNLHDNVSVLNIHDQLCKDNICSPYFNNKPVYFDSGHLSMMGSKIIGEQMVKTTKYKNVF